MGNSVDQLSAAGSLDRAQLECDPAVGVVAERMLALLADLAFEINRQAAAALGEAAESPSAAFGAAARAGLIDERLAAALALPDGPHHLLVQQYLDAEPNGSPEWFPTRWPPTGSTCVRSAARPAKRAGRVQTADRLDSACDRRCG